MASLHTASQNGEWITRILRSTTILLGFFLALSVVSAERADATCDGAPDGVIDAGEFCDDNNLVDGDGCDTATPAAQWGCTVTACGNDNVTSGEECDDGNTAGGDGCSAICVTEVCGNGTQDVGEECDDFNLVDNDGCSSTCTVEFCGDGGTQAILGEECDDGGTADAGGGGADTCDSDCSIARCGNNIISLNESNDPETCDDGNTAVGDGCNSTCQIEVCGNSVLDAGEECDDGNTADAGGGGADTCDSDCTIAVCGNGIASLNQNNDPEVCDDGNSVDGDGCSSLCLSDETCGNGTTDTATGEECDDGGTSPATAGMTCDSNCSVRTCGNGVVSINQNNDPEVCDDGNSVAGDGCNSLCQSDETCGNGITDTAAGEECDDGGTSPATAGMTCDSNCSVRACGNGVLSINENNDPEVCDDGNSVAGDGCSSLCVSDETCGNAITDTAAGEECDQGSTNSDLVSVGAPGCDTSCEVTECANGTTETGETCDDGGTAAIDGCGPTCQIETCGDGVIQPGLGTCVFDSSITCGIPVGDTGGIPGDDGGPFESCDNTDPIAGTKGGVCRSTLSDVPLPTFCDTDADCPDPLGIAAEDCLVCRPEICDPGEETATCNESCTPALCGDITVNASAACTTATAPLSGTCTSICYGTGPAAGTQPIYCASDVDCAAIGSVCGGLLVCTDPLYPGFPGAPFPGACVPGAIPGGTICGVGLCVPPSTLNPGLATTPLACDSSTEIPDCALPPAFGGMFGGASCLGDSCTSDSDCPTGETCPVFPGTAAMQGLGLFEEQCDDGNLQGTPNVPDPSGVPGPWVGLLPGQGYCTGTELAAPYVGVCTFDSSPCTDDAPGDDACDILDDGMTNSTAQCQVICDDTTAGACPTGETCEFSDDGDGCSALCQNESCGDFILDASEQCDDGNNEDGQCSTTTTTACSADEDCPDTETCVPDGCGATCFDQTCGNGALEPLNGEDCDPGVNSNCTGSCKDTFCGNGRVSSGSVVPLYPAESCDDGNTIPDDGCSATCTADLDEDGVPSGSDECNAGAVSEGKWIGRSYDDSVQKMLFKGDVDPASDTVCTDDGLPCDDDGDCTAGTCELFDMTVQGFEVIISSDSGGELYRLCVPGERDAEVQLNGGEYQFNSATPACGDKKDGYKRKDKPSGFDVTYRNRSGLLPQATLGVCLPPSEGIKRVKLSYNETKANLGQNAWKWNVVMKNSTLLAPVTSDADADNRFSVEGNLIATFIMGSGDCATGGQGMPGAAGMCADVKFNADPDLIPNKSGDTLCKVSRVGGANRNISCR